MKLRRPIALLLTATLISGLISPTSEAALITAEGDGIPHHDRVASLLHRQDVTEQLRAHGVTPNEAEARVAALTDDEAARMAAAIGEAPAGGIGPQTGVFIVYGIFLAFGYLMAAIVKAARSG